jgi:hypothetical protein
LSPLTFRKKYTDDSQQTYPFSTSSSPVLVFKIEKTVAKINEFAVEIHPVYHLENRL